MAGGDGSQALVATVASRRTSPTCASRPGPGTISRSISASTATTWSARSTRSPTASSGAIDLATVNGRVFVNNVSLGAVREGRPVARVPRRQARDVVSDAARFGRAGRVAAPRAAVRTTPTGRRPRTRRRCRCPTTLRDHAHGRRGHARADRPGRAGGRRARARGTGIAELARWSTSGLSARSSGLQVWASPSFVVEADGPVEVGLDGEALKLDAPLRFESVPRRAARAGADYARVVPVAAAVRLNAASLGTLLRTAAGR